MDLTINCGSFVEVNKLLSVIEINGIIKDFKLDENFLEGKALLSGKYVKDDSGETFKFEKEVPFTIVFKDNNIDINTIDIVNLKFSEVINQGIETTFEIFVEYDVLESNSEQENYDNEIELIEEVEFEEDNELDEIKDAITKSYEELLDDLLLPNRDNVEIKDIKKENNRVVFTKFKENYSTYTVFYPKDDREVEKICVENNHSLEDVYKRNGDFNEKRRIIL